MDSNRFAVLSGLVVKLDRVVYNIASVSSLHEIAKELYSIHGSTRLVTTLVTESTGVVSSFLVRLGNESLVTVDGERNNIDEAIDLIYLALEEYASVLVNIHKDERED